MPEVDEKHRTEHRPADAGELQNGNRSSRLQHPPHLFKTASVIGQVAEAESAADDVHRVVAKRQRQSVRLKKENRVTDRPA